jgi:LmbE family N-acetylglucosaminyl deacetylase
VVADEAVARLSEVFDRVRPDTIVTFGPDGHTGHPDHQAVSAWVDAAFDRGAPSGALLLHAAVTHEWVRTWHPVHQELGVFGAGYPVAVEDDQVVVDLVLDDGTAARKVTALAAQLSQTSGLIAQLGLPRYTRWVARESFVAARVDAGLVRS